MRAIRQHQVGPPDVLRLEELPDVHPVADQVRIDVGAAGVHLLDTLIRRGETGGPFPPPALPMTPGREVAGVVDEVGAGVDRALLGQQVVAHLGAASGGYASRAVAPVTSVRPIPDGVDAAAAVALIGTGRTAMAVLDLAAPTGDDVVVVTAAAGGLGNLFVQAARSAGATVVGLAGGPEKAAVVEQLGADVAVDYLRAGWTATVRERLGGKVASLVLDGVGGQLGRGAFDLLGAGGRIVMFGWSSGAVTPFTSSDLARAGSAHHGRSGRRWRRAGRASSRSSAGPSTKLRPVGSHRWCSASRSPTRQPLTTRSSRGPPSGRSCSFPERGPVDGDRVSARSRPSRRGGRTDAHGHDHVGALHPPRHEQRPVRVGQPRRGTSTAVYAGQRRRVGSRPGTAGIDDVTSQRPHRQGQHDGDGHQRRRERHRLAAVTADPSPFPSALVHGHLHCSATRGWLLGRAAPRPPRDEDRQVSSLARIGATEATV